MERSNQLLVREMVTRRTVVARGDDANAMGTDSASGGRHRAKVATRDIAWRLLRGLAVVGFGVAVVGFGVAALRRGDVHRGWERIVAGVMVTVGGVVSMVDP
jgi:hypothetical protein